MPTFSKPPNASPRRETGADYLKFLRNFGLVDPPVDSAEVAQVALLATTGVLRNTEASPARRMLFEMARAAARSV